jgi:hypothetical protein
MIINWQIEKIEENLAEINQISIQNLIQFMTFRNQINQEDGIIIDSIYDCQFSQNKSKISIHKGINKIRNSQIFPKCILKGGQNFRIMIEEQYNLIVLTVFIMTDWWVFFKIKKYDN